MGRRITQLNFFRTTMMIISIKDNKLVCVQETEMSACLKCCLKLNEPVVSVSVI